MNKTPLISGFTFLRNAQMLGYPFLESIQSILPICDEFVVNVGKSEDDTLQMIQKLAASEPKIKIIETTWNQHITAAGFVYAQQKMIAQYNCQYPWLFYLEADEIVHQNDLEKIKQLAEKHLHNKKVEAIAFNYLHFYGQYNTIITGPRWYRQEARMIKSSIRSYAPDGLFWTVLDKRSTKGRYPYAVVAEANIYHYGWARTSAQMTAKSQQTGKFWGLKSSKEKHDYSKVDGFFLKEFSGSHPKAIHDLMKNDTITEIFRADPKYKLSKKGRKDRLKYYLEKIFNIDLSKKHFYRAKV